MVTTIDEKLKLFAKIVFEKVQKESEDKVREFTSQYDKRLETEKQNILKQSEITINQTKRKAELKKNEIISKANIDGQYEILKKKKEIFDTTLSDIRKMAEAFTDKPEYVNYLEKCIKMCLSKIDYPEVAIFFKHQDISRYKDKICEIIEKHKKPGMAVNMYETEKDILGGCICEDVKKIVRFDCSMTSVIEDNRELIGKTLADNLK